MTTSFDTATVTPRKSVRYLGSARSGTGENKLMRLTSLALMPLTIFFVWLLVSLNGKDYFTIRDTIAQPIPALVILVFMLASLRHMQIGMVSIIVDYTHNRHMKELLLYANTIFSFIIGCAIVFAVFRISFV